MSGKQNQEDQASGDSSNKKSMLEKLTEHYWRNIQQGNGGHLVCYRSEISEKVQSEYPFPEGKFTLRSVYERYCKWDYDPIPSADSADKFKNNP